MSINNHTLAKDKFFTDKVEPYANDGEFLDDLQRALETDYEACIMGVQLEEAGRNINQFLRAFLM